MELLKTPFVWGLSLGLLVALFVVKSSFTARRHAKTEIKRLDKELKELQLHLNTQLKISASGNASIQDELDRLREQNETLRVNQAALQQKPGRAELRQLQVYEMAVRTMREQAPGFAPAWEKAVRDAEAEMAAAEGGFKKLIRRVIPGIGLSGAAPASSDESGKADAS